jgi:hypothetical protein
MRTKTSKPLAIERLIAAGHVTVAEELDHYRAKNGRDWGWDGWIRKRAQIWCL